MGLVGYIDILFTLDGEDLVLVINLAEHDTITQCLGDNELNVLGWDVELMAYIL